MNIQSMKEQILVVDRKILFGEKNERHFNGFSKNDFEEIINKNGRFVFRDDAENDPELKQIIPYLVFKYKNDLFV